MHVLKNLYAKRLSAQGNAMNTVTANAIERRLFLVVGGGMTSNGKLGLESDILDRLDWLGDEHPELKRICYLFLVKSMADAAAMVRQYVRENEEESAFHTSAAVIIIRNEALEFVNRKWATRHYSSLQDHIPHPVVFPEGANIVSINFDAYPGKGPAPDYAWQNYFPDWRNIQDVDPEAWLYMLNARNDVSIHRITRNTLPELGEVLIAAASEQALTDK